MNHCLSQAELEHALEANPTDPIRGAAFAHADECSRCRTALRLARDRDNWLNERLAALEPTEMPHSVDSALAAIAFQVRARKTARRKLVLAISGVAAATLLFSVALPWPHRDGNQKPKIVVEGADDALNGFIALDGLPIQMGVIVRITLSSSTLAQLGVRDVRDTEADLIVGEDGVAHAIRFVR